MPIAYCLLPITYHLLPIDLLKVVARATTAGGQVAGGQNPQPRNQIGGCRSRSPAIGGAKIAGTLSGNRL